MKHTILFLFLIACGVATAQNTVNPCIGMGFLSSRGVVAFGSSDVSVLLYITDSLRYEQNTETTTETFQEFSKGGSTVSCWYKSGALVSVLESVIGNKYDVLIRYSDLQLYFNKTYGKPAKVISGKKLAEQWQWLVSCGKQKRKIKLCIDYDKQDAVMYYGVELLSQAAPNGTN